jgi:hypothetical protein
LISAFCLPNFCFDFVLSQFLFLILRFQLFRDGAANFYVGAGTKGERREFKRRKIFWLWELPLGRGVEEAGA